MLLGIPRLVAEKTKAMKTAVEKWEKRAVMGTDGEKMELARREGWEASERVRGRLGLTSWRWWELQLVPRQAGGDSSLCSSFPLLAFLKR